MQTLAEQKKDLEEQIASKEKAISDAEQALSVDKALLKQDKNKLSILEEAISPTTKPKKEKLVTTADKQTTQPA